MLGLIFLKPCQALVTDLDTGLRDQTDTFEPFLVSSLTIYCDSRGRDFATEDSVLSRPGVISPDRVSRACSPNVQMLTQCPEDGS